MAARRAKKCEKRWPSRNPAARKPTPSTIARQPRHSRCTCGSASRGLNAPKSSPRSKRSSRNCGRLAEALHAAQFERPETARAFCCTRPSVLSLQARLQRGFKGDAGESQASATLKAAGARLPSGVAPSDVAATDRHRPIATDAHGRAQLAAASSYVNLVQPIRHTAHGVNTTGCMQEREIGYSERPFERV